VSHRSRPLDDHQVRELVDQLPAIIAYWDRDQRCRFASRAYDEWFGQGQPIAGTRLADALGPVYELNRSHIEAALAGQRQEFDRVLPNPAGGPPRPSRITYIPDVEKGSVRGFFVLVVDLAGATLDLGPSLNTIERTLSQSIDELGTADTATQLREHLIRAREETRALRERHDTVAGHFERQPIFLAELFSSLDESVIAVDLELRVQVWSLGAERMFGRRAAEMIGHPVFSQTRPEWSAADAETWKANVLARGNVREVGTRQRAGATPVVVETNYAVLRDARGEPIGIVGIGRDVTERETQRTALAASEARYRAVVSAMSEGVVVRSASGALMDVNAAALELLGLEREHLTGQQQPPPGWHALDADGKPTRSMLGSEVLRTGEPAVERVGTVLHPNGRKVWLRLNAQPLRDSPDGLPTGVVTTFTDITSVFEAKQREVEQARLAGFERRSNEAELVLRDGVVVHANDRALSLYGYLREELLGKHVRELRAEATVGQVDAQMQVANTAGLRFETEHRRRDGATFPVEVSSRGFEVRGERYLHSLVRDLTETRRAEGEHRLLAGLMRGMSDAVMVMDPTFHVTEYTGASERLYGWTREEVLGKCLRTDFVAEFPDHDLDAYRASVASGQQSQVMMHAQRKTGDWIDLDTVVSPLRDGNGTLTGWMSVARDVTVRREAEEKLRAALAENERLVAELREAANNVKTLSGLLPICMYCKKIRDDGGYWERIEQYIGTHSDASFSHGMCPDCYHEHFPEDHE
jgi:PAS domain S-box-containing protein